MDSLVLSAYCPLPTAYSIMDDATPYSAECSFCGQKFPPALPEAQRQALAAHIAQCKAHPLHQAASQRDQLRNMLGSLLDRCERRGGPGVRLVQAARKLWKETNPKKEAP